MNLAETSTLRVVLMEPEKGASQASSRFEKMQALLERGYSVTRATPGGNTSPNPRTSMLVVGEFTDGKRPSDLESEGLEVRFEEAAGLDTESLVQKA
ncbi:MAG: ferredoxin family protein, partial [Verrucomicrobiota bacterium]|nr:ferredoxin family protein [Verrucomicrobiota bacterium]